MKPQKIRTATNDDAPALAAIAVSSGLFPQDEETMFHDMAAEQIASEDNAGHWLVAFPQDEPGTLVGGAYVAPDGLSQDVWNLLFIAVAPHHQRNGVGGHLLANVEQLARSSGVRILIIETSSDPAQAAARKFCSGRGYKQQGLITDYYQPGEDKVIFARSL
ncbi:MAG: GNAT family N-acetyltransferase [Pikeienuella sp.]